jgi:hypothetical protein
MERPARREGYIKTTSTKEVKKMKRLNACLAGALMMLLVAASLQAVTITDYTGDGGTTKLSANSMGRLSVLERKVTCSTVPMAANDVYQLFDIPPNTLVFAVSWEVETTNNVTATFDIGDDTNPDGFINSASANAVTSGCSVLSSAGKFYSATDTIDLTAQAGLTNLVMYVRAVCVQVE